MVMEIVGQENKIIICGRCRRAKGNENGES